MRVYDHSAILPHDRRGCRSGNPASEQESARLPADIAFPEPALSDRELGRDFLQLHRALEAPTTRLEHEQRPAEWLRALIERTSAVRLLRSPLNPHDDRALRWAYDYLADQPERNAGLDELAAAGIGKFRLIRLFRGRTGLAPTRCQVAHRIRKARQLLEAGETIAVAAAGGLADGGEGAAAGRLVEALHGDCAQVRCALAQLLRVLVNIRLVPALRGREVLELQHHEAGRLPVALEDGQLAATGEEAAAARCDRAWRRGLVLLVLLRVSDVGFDDDVCRHDRNLR
jgi:AraC-like DNA-binding protein